MVKRKTNRSTKTIEVAEVETAGNVVAPLKPMYFGLQTHQYGMYSARTPSVVDKQTLEDPRFWAFLAPKLRVGDEVRVVADDCTFRAVVYCTFSRGTDARMRVVEYALLDEVDYTALTHKSSEYSVEFKGLKGWCILKSDGTIIEEDLPNQGKALQKLDEYIKALAA